MGSGRRLLSPLGPNRGHSTGALQRIHRLLTSALAACICLVPALAQTSQPESVWELPESARAALAETEDFAFNFDQPGFYAVVEFVRESAHSPGFAQAPTVVTDWRDLLERPADFRGRPITVTGEVGRNKAPYTLHTRPELGELSQIELAASDQPLACTLICTGRVADVPLGSTITATGYFVMIRQYHGAGGRVLQSALIVSPGPTSIDRPAPHAAATTGTDWHWIAGAILLGVLITVVLLRRSAGSRHTDVRTLRASKQAPMHLADDLAQWADNERSDDH